MADSQLISSPGRDELLRSVLDQVFAFVAILTPDGRLVEVNRAPLDAAALRREEVVGQRFAETYWWSYSSEAQQELARTIQRAAAGDVVRNDFEIRVAGDAIITVRGKFSPLRDETGRVRYIVASGVDISDRKRQERALVESDERFQQLAHAIREVFWLFDADADRFVYVSPGYERIWGRSPQVLEDQSFDWRKSIHPGDRERTLALMRAGAPYDEEYRIIRPDGAVRWIRDHAFPLEDASGRVIRMAGVAEDITARRDLETQVRHAQKIESIGQLAGGVAHDFNNLLTVIAGNAELLLNPNGPDDLRHLVSEIFQACERGASLTRQLLAFSRRQILDPKVLDVNAIVTDAERLLLRLVGEEVAVTTSLGPDLHRVRMDPGCLTQILMNLAVNARDAMPGGGSLSIETWNAEHGPAGAPDAERSAPTGWVVLSITDTGIGMLPEVRARALEPFFTTKGPGKGTGLGLSVVYGIVEQSGGHIEILSAPDRGTRVNIFLPAVDRGSADASAALSATRRGNETILLVEEDAHVRKLAAGALKASGYNVLVAQSGDDAVRLAAAQATPVHLLITDAAERADTAGPVVGFLTARFPDVQVLYTSGYPADAVARDGRGPAVLRKPYTPVTLTGKVRDVLDRKD
jgi:PAS domain S-box-containing protein